MSINLGSFYLLCLSPNSQGFFPLPLSFSYLFQLHDTIWFLSCMLCHLYVTLSPPPLARWFFSLWQVYFPSQIYFPRKHSHLHFPHHLRLTDSCSTFLQAIYPALSTAVLQSLPTMPHLSSHSGSRTLALQQEGSTTSENKSGALNNAQLLLWYFCHYYLQPLLLGHVLILMPYNTAKYRTWWGVKGISLLPRQNTLMLL